jgi:hypothetical protein
MEKDSSPKLNASLHETDLKRTKNLQLTKRQGQQLQLPQPAAEAAVAATASLLQS